MIIEHASEIAPWVQLFEYLKMRITSGELKAGARLPSVNQLAAEVGLARVTAHKALARLRDEGLVTVSPGRGYYVRRDSGDQ